MRKLSQEDEAPHLSLIACKMEEGLRHGQSCWNINSKKLSSSMVIIKTHTFSIANALKLHLAVVELSQN